MNNYPITPMADRINASLRLASLAMLFSSSKTEGTNGWRTPAEVVMLVSERDEGRELLDKAALTLATGLHGANDTAPRIHNAFTQRNDVVEHLVRTIRASGDGGSLLQYLGHNGKVCLKVPADSTGNIAETLENGGLELIGECSALKEE